LHHKIFQTPLAYFFFFHFQKWEWVEYKTETKCNMYADPSAAVGRANGQT